MAIEDYFNYGAGANLSVMGDDNKYQSNQFNSQGQSLSPSSTGAPITTDYNNDQRTAWDYKQQARQAQIDTMPAQNMEGKILSKDGSFLYDKIPDTREDAANNAAMSFIDGYFSHMGSQNEAIAAGGMAASQQAQAHKKALDRQNMIPQLEATGRYNPMDISTWVQTGNTKDLLTNQGTWTSDGNGFMHNSLTGETREIPGYQAAQQKQLQHIDTGGEISFVDNTGKVVSTVSKTLKPGEVGSGGSIGLDDEEASQGYTKQANGQWTKPKYNSKGQQVGVDVANAKQTEQLNAASAASTPSATEVQQSANVNTLLNASDEDLDGMTGRFDQNLGLDNPLINQQSSNRPVYAAAKEMEGYMQNQGVGAAKAMGLSGINTLEEAKRAFASMPQLDRSSPAAFRASVQRINKYITDYNANSREEKGVAPAQTNTPATTGKDHSNLW